MRYSTFESRSRALNCFLGQCLCQRQEDPYREMLLSHQSRCDRSLNLFAVFALSFFFRRLTLYSFAAERRSFQYHRQLAIFGAARNLARRNSPKQTRDTIGYLARALGTKMRPRLHLIHLVSLCRPACVVSVIGWRACWPVCEFINRWLTYAYLVARNDCSPPPPPAPG